MLSLSSIATLLKLSGHAETAEDIVQEAFVRVLKNLERFAMLKDDIWLQNARVANAAAAEIAGACGERLLHPVEANEIFMRCTPGERETLRAQHFEFYDWGDDSARFVTAWNTPQEHAICLAKAITNL